MVADVDAPGEREYTISPKGQYMQWVLKRVAKEYPNIDGPVNVRPTFDASKKYFKDWNPEQRLLRISIDDRVYDVTTNNRPLLGSAVIVSRVCHTHEGVKRYPQVVSRGPRARMDGTRRRSVADGGRRQPGLLLTSQRHCGAGGTESMFLTVSEHSNGVLSDVSAPSSDSSSDSDSSGSSSSSEEDDIGESSSGESNSD